MLASTQNFSHLAVATAKFSFRWWRMGEEEDEEIHAGKPQESYIPSLLTTT